MTTTIITTGKFSPGRIMITPGAMTQLPPDEAVKALFRHMSGDWGELDFDDRKRNEAALKHGFRLASRYVTPTGTTFWIITEPDRSATVIMLATEY